MNAKDDSEVELVRKAVQQLGDHFETVQVFVSRHDPAILEGTRTINLGAGNWFTRYGQIKDWIIKTDEGIRMDAQKWTEEEGGDK